MSADNPRVKLDYNTKKFSLHDLPVENLIYIPT